MTWRSTTSAVIDSTLVPVLVVTGGCSGRPALDSDSAESALYLISTSRYKFPSFAITTTAVSGFQCVSANNLPRS